MKIGTAYYISTFVSAVLAIVSVVIYWCLPSFDFINEFENSQLYAVVVLIASPVSATLGMIVYVTGGLIDKTAIKKKFIFFSSLGVFAELTVVSMAFLLRRDTLGFIAPFYDLGWKTLGILNIFAVIVFILLNAYFFYSAKKQ